MKPSEHLNGLSHPPPRTMLPLRSPGMWDRLGPSRHPIPPQQPLSTRHFLQPTGPIHSPGFVPSSPSHIGSPVNRPHPLAGCRLAPLQNQHHQPPQSLCSSRSDPVSTTNSGTTAFPQFMKDLSNHSLSSHIRREQGTESKVTLSYSGSKNVIPQRQASSKDQSSDVRSSIETVELRRPPMSPSFYTRGIQGVPPRPTSDSERRGHWSSSGYQPSPSTQPSYRSSGSSLPLMHNLLSHGQEQHKQTPPSENIIPVVDLNCTSQKRHRDFQDLDDSPKKMCLSTMNSGQAQTPKPTVGRSLSAMLTPLSKTHSLALERSPETSNRLLCRRPSSGQSPCLELSSAINPAQSSCASTSLKPCIKNRPMMGVKQSFLKHTQDDILKLRSPSKSLDEESLKQSVPLEDTGGAPRVQPGTNKSVHTDASTSGVPANAVSRGDHTEESRKPGTSTPKHCSKTSTAERNKTSRLRRPVAIPNDLDELFTPDPLTYVVSSGHKTPKLAGIKSPSSENSSSSSTVNHCSLPTNGSSCRMTSSHMADTKVLSQSSAHHAKATVPTVALVRVKLEPLKYTCPKDSKKSPLTSSVKKPKEDILKSDDKPTPLLPNQGRRGELETGPATSTSHCSRLLPLERRASEGRRRPASEDDPIDLDLDLGLSFAVDMDLTQSSQSSEEEQLLSLQEMMERVSKPPATPGKWAFSEPGTPGHDSSPSKTPLPATKLGIYKNNLDQMLEEININKRAKEIETQLLTACQEDLLRIAEYEEAEENREEGVSSEQKEFLQRYSLMSNAIREVPPGEAVFNLERFGQIFDEETLQLRRCTVNPQGMAQKTLLWSSPAQLRLHLNIGLFQEAYDCRSPCPTQVTRFLFKMMSVHSERLVCEKILQALCDIACTAAYQIVKNESQQFKVWVPSLADVALVLLNMGVSFVTLFPFENLQPPFTEGDLLEDIHIKSESPSSKKEPKTFPEHNINNILTYLSYCMGLCPRVYSDDELLLLLTVVGKVGLDSRLLLTSSTELYPLQCKIVNNVRDWDTMLPRICMNLSDLTDDHHNMCLLVQLLPQNTRGKQLRRHLSLSMISKLLNGTCTYRPKETEFELSDLRPFLPRMQPSALLRSMLSQRNKEEDVATLDQQSYYLCYSLLTLANEASNYPFFPANQKTQLLSMCSELETHVKCDIRESEKCLYRSKVKDLVARIYTKWQMLLQRTRPLHGKLYDYWQPLPVDTLTSSQEEYEMDNSDDGEGPVFQEEEERPNDAEQILIIDEDEDEEDDTTDDTNETENYMTAEETLGDDTKEETHETGDDMTADDMFGDDKKEETNETRGDLTSDDMLGDDKKEEINETGDDMTAEDMFGDDTKEERHETGDDMTAEDMFGDNTKEETHETGGDMTAEDMFGDDTKEETHETGDDMTAEDMFGDDTKEETHETGADMTSDDMLGDDKKEETHETGGDMTAEDMFGDDTKEETHETRADMTSDDMLGDDKKEETHETGDDMTAEDMFGDDTKEETCETRDDMTAEDMSGDDTKEKTNETGENDMRQEELCEEMEPKEQEQTEAGGEARSQVVSGKEPV
ncbi:SMC5-SMC6 complex localization factor protein 2 isoform X2 [Pungitius pungitius]|uniref:SMC5-SMC6 complex localization factor protein 2 isoform X2 n=1 Tax=Pungitius pungitius TaxID=134920 RepID=UPI002E0D3FBB